MRVSEADRIFPFLALNQEQQRKRGKGIPWSVIAEHEAQAQANHSQTLQRLAERGGLSPAEMFYVLHDLKWPSGGINFISEQDALAAIKSFVDFRATIAQHDEQIKELQERLKTWEWAALSKDKQLLEFSYRIKELEAERDATIVKLAQRVVQMTDVLNAIKIRIAYIGWPGESFWNPSPDQRIPDWRDEIALIEAAINTPPTEAEQRAKDNAEKAAKWDEYMACVEADEKLAAAMRDGEELKECTTFGPAAIERRVKDDERRKTDPQMTMWKSDYDAMQAKAQLWDKMLPLARYDCMEKKWTVQWYGSGRDAAAALRGEVKG